MFHSGRGAGSGTSRALPFALTLAVAGALSGCSADAAGPGNAADAPCVDFESARLATVKTSVRELATTSSGASLTQLVPNLVTSESGLYWYDGAGSVYGVRQGSSTVRELRRGPEPSASEVRHPLVHGIAAGADRVYIGEAYLEPAGDYVPLIPDPPGRLLSIPAQGGAVKVLLELDDGVVTPVAVEDGRLIVFVQGGSPGFYSVDETSGRREPLPIRSQFFNGRRSGGTLYVSDDDYPASLLRSGFDDAEPTPVMALESPYFYVGPEHVLTRRERLREPDHVREELLVVHDPASGCTRALPGLGEAISYETAVDRESVYWLSSRSPDTPVPEGASGPDLKLIRASLSTGALTRIDPSDVALDGARIVGQDDATLYVMSGATLLAIDKP